MGTATAVTLEQYFANETKPACEYVDGELIQKSVPSNLHSELQALLTYFLMVALGAPNNRVRIAQNLRLSGSVIRVPDVCVVEPGNLDEGLALSDPPLLCVEILSPSDRFSATVKKCQDYLRWGVASCWILDPALREAWDVTLTGVQLVPSDSNLLAGEISLNLQTVFDQMHRN